MLCETELMPIYYQKQTYRRSRAHEEERERDSRVFGHDDA